MVGERSSSTSRREHSPDGSEPCDRCEELLQDFLDRTLSDAEWREAETHLSDCDYCRRRYRFEETLRRYVRTSSVERMPPGLMDKLAELRGLDATGLEPRLQILRRVDVAGRAEVVARDEAHGPVAESLVRDAAQSARPRTSGWPRSPSYDAATTLRARATRRARARPLARREVRPVGEDDDRRIDVVAERSEPAAKRGPGPRSQSGQRHDACT